MARPVEFDRDEAVASAIRVFARHGYEAASTADLLDGMGISRQSLYGAFGDKRRLFLEALRRYSAGSLAEMTTALRGSGPAPAAIEAGLLVGLGSSDELETGCLGVGSIVEFSRTDPDVNALNDEAAAATVAAFADRIAKGIAAGELAPDLDAEATGRMLLVLRSGLRVAARGGAGTDALRDTVRLALRALVSRSPASRPAAAVRQ